MAGQNIENPRVGGSIPSPATSDIKGLQRCRPFSLWGHGSKIPTQSLLRRNSLPHPPRRCREAASITRASGKLGRCSVLYGFVRPRNPRARAAWRPGSDARRGSRRRCRCGRRGSHRPVLAPRWWAPSRRARGCCRRSGWPGRQANWQPLPATPARVACHRLKAHRSRRGRSPPGCTARHWREHYRCCRRPPRRAPGRRAAARRCAQCDR